MTTEVTRWRMILVGAAVFAAFGLLGPAVRLATPVGLEEGVAGRISLFVEDLTPLVWPTHPLGVVEASLGRAATLAITVGANLVAFAALGAASALVGRSRLWAPYVVTCAANGAIEAWWSGLDLHFVNWLALALAFTFYAAAFLLLARTMLRHPAGEPCGEAG